MGSPNPIRVQTLTLMVRLWTLCISGKLPSGKKKADYESALSAIGIKLVDDVSSSLTYLVVADPHVSTGKAQKARMLDIPIMSEDDLTAMLKK